MRGRTADESELDAADAEDEVEEAAPSARGVSLGAADFAPPPSTPRGKTEADLVEDEIAGDLAPPEGEELDEDVDELEPEEPEAEGVEAEGAELEEEVEETDEVEDAGDAEDVALPEPPLEAGDEETDEVADEPDGPGADLEHEGSEEGEPGAEDAPRGPRARREGEAVERGPVISSRKNTRIHLARALGTRRGRRREEKYLVEGPKVIRELLDRDVPLELVLWKEGVEQRADTAELIALARSRQVDVFAVAPALFEELASTETSQGVLAVAHQRWGDLDAVLGPVPEDPATAPPRAVLVAAGVQDPGNLGTILRSARFLGIAGVICLSGTTDPWSPKVVRASAGALLESPPARVETIAKLVELGKARGYRTVALVAHAGRTLEASPLPERSLILLGAEGPGLSPAAVEASEEKVTILPSDAKAESLNAAMAFALAAYAWRTAWANPGKG